MDGMRKMSAEEMKVMKGGKCNRDYGYYFCCPLTSTIMTNNIQKYLDAGQTAKAKAYIQFCYEDCGYTG